MSQPNRPASLRRSRFVKAAQIALSIMRVAKNLVLYVWEDTGWLAHVLTEPDQGSFDWFCFTGALRQFELVELDVERLTWATAG